MPVRKLYIRLFFLTLLVNRPTGLFNIGIATDWRSEEVLTLKVKCLFLTGKEELSFRIVYNNLSKFKPVKFYLKFDFVSHTASMEVF